MSFLKCRHHRHRNRLKFRGSKRLEIVSLPSQISDRVMGKDCPGHWSWASPFTVEAIDGEMVKLEMVDELVKVSKLSLIL